MIRHAGLVALRVAGFWRGALIEGPSGSGKSDLALRAMGQGLRLVADDRVVVWASGGGLFGRAPDALAGLIEVRGLGVMPADALHMAQIVLLARLVSRPERTPDAVTENLLGIALPVLQFSPFEGSAAAKLGRAIEAFDPARKGGI